MEIGNDNSYLKSREWDDVTLDSLMGPPSATHIQLKTSKEGKSWVEQKVAGQPIQRWILMPKLHGIR